MPKKATIDPGARVYAGSDYLGTVERTVHREDAPATDYPDLTVRAADDGALYHIPGALVRSRRRSHGHTLVHADLGARPLASFQSAEPASATLATPATPSARNARRTDTAQQRRDHEADHDAGADSSNDAPVRRIPVWSETLVAEKRPVTLDTLHLRKRTESAEQRMQVPLEHEEVVVEHLRPDQYDGHTADGPDEWIIPVHEERLVVRKQIVIAGYVRITRHRHTETRDISDTVRREVVGLDSDAASHLTGPGPRADTIPPTTPAPEVPSVP